MIECFSLHTRSGPFTVHFYNGCRQEYLFVFIPGLMEPKAGLFYIFHDFAKAFYSKGHSALLFDLGGQGDSTLPLSMDVWQDQLEAILSYFKNAYHVHFIARGIGSLLLKNNFDNSVLFPCLYDPVKELLKEVRWKQLPNRLITPAYPNQLSDSEKNCFYYLGAEAECIGNMKLSLSFIQELEKRLPHQLPNGTRIYEPVNDHPLFDKQHQRNHLLEQMIGHLFG